MESIRERTLTAREASTLAIALASVAVSLGWLTVSAELGPSSRFLLGYYSAYFGLVYREMNILQMSIEGNLLYPYRRKPGVHILRFLRSFFFRIGQIFPMAMWILWVDIYLKKSCFGIYSCLSALLLLPSIPYSLALLVATLFLTLIEDRWLWEPAFR